MNTSSSQPAHPLVGGQDLQNREAQIISKEEEGEKERKGRYLGKDMPFCPV